MRGLIRALAAGFTVLEVAVSASSAKVPQFINYQGRLVDGTNLVNGHVGLSLRLYDAPGGGNLFYEDSNSVALVDGLYSTLIGDNTTSGSLAKALTNESVWLEVAVNGVALSPRERTASVPYALHADDAASLGGRPFVAFATGTPLYVESDPLWPIVSNSIQAQLSTRADSNTVWLTFATTNTLAAERAERIAGASALADAIATKADSNLAWSTFAANTGLAAETAARIGGMAAMSNLIGSVSATNIAAGESIAFLPRSTNATWRIASEIIGTNTVKDRNDQVLGMNYNGVYNVTSCVWNVTDTNLPWIHHGLESDYGKLVEWNIDVAARDLYTNSPALASYTVSGMPVSRMFMLAYDRATADSTEYHGPFNLVENDNYWWQRWRTAKRVAADSSLDIFGTSPTFPLGHFGGLGTNGIDIIATGGTLGVGTYTDHPLVLGANNTEGLRLDASSNAIVVKPGWKLYGDGSALSGVSGSSGSDTSRVAKTGDTMNGTLNLPVGGLAVGTTQVVVTSGGNVGIGTANPTNKLDVAGNVGANAFVTLSDRNAKENFRTVDLQGVLEKISALPVVTWSFRDERGITHLGPMAQDFHAAFHLGHDERHIATVDADGVAFAAIQALAKQNAGLKAEIDALKARLDAIAPTK